MLPCYITRKGCEIMDHIAIVGAGCLLPGYTDKELFWEKLMGNEKVTKIEKVFERVIDRGGFPKEGSKEFFQNHFHADELRELDAYGELYKWVIYVIREALMESGYYKNYDLMKRTGLIMGSLGMPVHEQIDVFKPVIETVIQKKVRTIVNDDNFVFQFSKANRDISVKGSLTNNEPQNMAVKKFSLGGPVLSVNAACATPLYAFKLAALYLNSHQADIMIAGSHCSNENPMGNYGLFNLLGVICDAGKSIPLDHHSEGLITASAAGAFVLKRLEDAVRDKDTILAVVENIGLSNDGGAKSILAPVVEGQMAAYRAAYVEDMSCDVDYIECHATGTHAGDQVEMESIAGFFHKKGYYPLLGGVKAYTGHAFTASGNAAILKTILSMKYNVIPATLGVKSPMCDDIVLKNTGWIQKGSVKRAAINAFGFGGINAHMVLREYQPETGTSKNLQSSMQITEKIIEKMTEKPAEKPTGKLAGKPTELAITGMGIHVGAVTSLEGFMRNLTEAKNFLSVPDQDRWGDYLADVDLLKQIGLDRYPMGAYVNSMDFDFMRYKIPIKDDPYLLRRDLLLLDTVAKALEDANITVGSHPDTAVIINFLQDFSDIHFMTSAEMEKEILRCLDQTCPSLEDRQKKEVLHILRQDERKRETADTVTGMISNIKVNRVSAHWRFTGPSFVIMEKENAMGRLIELARFFINEKICKTAVIGTIELSAELEHLYLQKELGNMDKMLELGIGEGSAVIVLKSKEQAEQEEDRIYSIINDVVSINCKMEDVLPDSLDRLINNSGIGKSEIGYMEIPSNSRFGHQYDFKDFLCKRYHDQIDRESLVVGNMEEYMGYGFGLTSIAAIIKNSLQHYYATIFRISTDNNAVWRKSGYLRASLVSSFTEDGDSSHIIMTDYITEQVLGRNKQTGKYLYAIGFDDKQELIGKLNELSHGNGRNSNQLFHEKNDDINHKYIISIVFDSLQSFQEEIGEIRKNIDTMLDSPNVYESARGSYFTANPLGENAEIVFMNPPGGMGKREEFLNLLFTFEKYKNMYQQFTEIKNEEVNNTDYFEGYVMDIFTSMVSMKILTDEFGIMPHKIVGASMGEISANYASDSVYSNIEMVEVMREVLMTLGNLLNDEQAILDYFDHKTRELENWYIKGDLKKIAEIVEKYDDLFITIIGSPKDVFVCGAPESCANLINNIAGYSIKIKGIPYIHTPIANKYRNTIIDSLKKYECHIKQELPYEIYSTYFARKMDHSIEMFADNFANIITEPVDFNRVIEKLYADGSRVFIDLSTGGQCQSWANSIVNGRDALIFGLYTSQYDTHENIIRICAKLVANKCRTDRNKLKNEKQKSHLLRNFKNKVTMGPTDNITRFRNNKKWQELPAANVKAEAISKPDSKLVSRPENKPENKPERKSVSKSENVKNNLFITFMNNQITQKYDAYKMYMENEKRLIHRMESASHDIVEKPSCLWDRDQIIEMSERSMANVLGPVYAQVDTYQVRARLPLPPFMFVSRITKIDAELNNYRPSMIEMEYDVDDSCIMKMGNTISSVVLSESSQIGILLVAYIGIDITSNGTLRYRIANTKTMIHADMPLIGETVRGVFAINSFIKNGSTTLISYMYTCYKKDKLILSSEGIGGFFTEKDLENSKGIIENRRAAKKKGGLKKVYALRNDSKTKFTETDMEHFFNGKMSLCFSDIEDFEGHYINPKVRMVDTVENIELQNGDYGLGQIIGRKRIDKSHWAFSCHFKNDPVLPGSLMLEGINQLLFFYLLYCGFVNNRKKEIEPIHDMSINTAFRGQVMQMDSTLEYVINIREVIEESGKNGVIVDADVYWQGKNILRSENISIMVNETSGENLRKD